MDSQFSRSAEGEVEKCSERLDIPVPPELKEDAAFVARASGYSSTSEWARMVLAERLYGSVHRIQSLVRGGGNGNGNKVP